MYTLLKQVFTKVHWNWIQNSFCFAAFSEVLPRANWVFSKVQCMLLLENQEELLALLEHV